MPAPFAVRGRVYSPWVDVVIGHAKAMFDILQQQQFNTALPAGVPPGTAVAHKTGSITRLHHDAGIVFGPRPYVLVLLVRGSRGPGEERRADGGAVAGGLRGRKPEVARMDRLPPLPGCSIWRIRRAMVSA